LIHKPLEPNATIGILGGGQLGRMLSVAASRLGLKTHIFDPSTDPPAGHVAHSVTTAKFSDTEALKAFADQVHIVTYEFENIPTKTLDFLEAHCMIRPGREALRVSQDRLTEKLFLQSLGLNTANFIDVSGPTTLQTALRSLGTPAILKTRQFGYDGKGQLRLSDPDDIPPDVNSLLDRPSILEQVVHFEREISVIAARGFDGSIASFDPGENIHQDGILRTTTVPARITVHQKTEAVLHTAKILNALNYVGVIGVEFFVTFNDLIINEFAPRVHNSGHWTQNGCAVDQFEQHIRAIASWPLSDGHRHNDVVMENIIGDTTDVVFRSAKDTLSALHLYGKVEANPSRKMGHINRISPKN